ncbi:MAG: hypothetical protein SEPTF4163_006555 [Sporothrix epigloea]
MTADPNHVDLVIVDPSLMDPTMTDEEIIATFTPLEKQFYEWQIIGRDEVKRLGEDYLIDKAYFYKRLAEKFPIPNVKEAYWRFSKKWHGRVLRRMRIAITPQEFYERLRTTDCKKMASLGDTSLWMHVYPVPDLLFGQSSFGGAVMHYALETGPRYLYPDRPQSKTIDPTSPDTLMDTVLAIDIDVDNARPLALMSQPNVGPLRDLKKRRRDDIGSEENSGISARSAHLDDFLDRQPFVFFQIGALHCCTAEEWLKRDTEYADELYEPEFEETGYGVVVRLDSDGFPTGAVYIVYRFQKEAPLVVSKVPGEPAFHQEREWQDLHGVELPHIRRLYPACKQKFFLAKIADNLADLKEDGQFDIQVISEVRQMVVLAKKAGNMQKIIPDMVEVSLGENKRSHRGGRENIDE